MKCAKMLLLLLAVTGYITSATAYSLPKEDEFEYKHHDNNEIEMILKSIHRRCPEITKLFSLSERSVLGQKINGIIFGNVPSRHQPMTPEVKYVGATHGNEVVGKEVLIRLAHYLCETFRSNDAEVRRLLHLTRIHILPVLNPDGSELAAAASYKERNEIIGRANYNSVDLNRDYPKLDKIWFANHQITPWNNHHLWYNETEILPMLAPETRGMIKWLQSVPFVLSGALHGGDLVVNYPLDSPISSKPGLPSTTPDELLFQELANSYALKHPSMVGSKCYPDEPGFKNGIVNGAAWYSMRGGMEDFHYFATNCYETIMEIGCVKYPNNTELPYFWEENKESLMNYMWQAHLGIKGIVYQAASGLPIPDAEIQVSTHIDGEWEPIWHFVTTAAHGDYYRLLLNGKYMVTASKKGFVPVSHIVVVRNHPKKGATKVDFAMTPNVAV